MFSNSDNVEVDQTGVSGSTLTSFLGTSLSAVLATQIVGCVTQNSAILAYGFPISAAFIGVLRLCCLGVLLYGCVKVSQKNFQTGALLILGALSFAPILLCQALFIPLVFIWWAAAGLISSATLLLGLLIFLSLAACFTYSSKQARVHKKQELDLLHEHGSARWASTKDLKSHNLLSGDGIVLGQWGRSSKAPLITYNGEGNVILASPPRSGKGVGVVIPTLLNWKESAIINDVKGELWQLTSGYRRETLGQKCIRLDLTASDGATASWNPLLEIRPYPNDVRDAQMLALSLLEDELDKTKEVHWVNAAMGLLEGLFLHQLYCGIDKSLGGCYRLLNDPSNDLRSTLKEMILTVHDLDGRYNWRNADGTPTRTHPAVAQTARGMLNKDDRELSAITSSAEVALKLFKDPVLSRNTETSDFSVSDLMNLETPVSLYLTTPVSDIGRVATLIRLLFGFMGKRLTEKLEFENGLPVAHYKHKLLFLIDEMRQLGKMDILQQQLSLTAGYGIKALLVLQDYAQIKDLYGKDETITTTCDVRISFATNKIETAQYLSQMLGRGTGKRQGKSISGQRTALFMDRASSTERIVGRDLLRPEEVQTLSNDDCLVFLTNCPPIRANKFRYYAAPLWAKRASFPAPSVTDRIVAKTPHWATDLVPQRPKPPSGTSELRIPGAAGTMTSVTPSTATADDVIDMVLSLE